MVNGPESIGADEAFLLKDESVVARRKSHVLLIDVSGIPPQFGDPSRSRSDIAIALGGTIMACWTGAT